MLEEIFKQPLTEAQNKINEMYEKDGLTNEVFELQVKINKVRATLNISDETKTIYENFVQ